MNEQDLGRIAENGQRAAELLTERGMRALTAAASWRNTQHPDTAPDLGDLTITTADVDRDKRDKLDPFRHPRLVAAINAYSNAAATLTWLLLDTIPRTPDQPRPDEAPEGACRNCWTDNQHFEPIDRFKDLCRWCGDFRANEGQLPPLALLQLRHQGRKVTTADVDRALGRRRRTA